MKLHLGCGHKYLDGWINIDGTKDNLCYDDLKADVYSNIEDLEYPDNSIDEILMEAVFEHFPRHNAILQLRKFYKWLIVGGIITILVPDFWGTVDMLKKSKNVKEEQFWFRHLFGPQDTTRFGTHYDAFDIKKLKWMFSVVGFNDFDYTIIKRWPSIRFAGEKGKVIKNDINAKNDIIEYMAYYEAKDETGIAFNAWMNAMDISATKPETETFTTQNLYKKFGIFKRLKNKISRLINEYFWNNK